MFIPITSGDFFEKPSPSSEPGRVYVIDDRVAEMGFLRMGLERAGYQAVLCADAAIFASKFSVRGCTAVLVDVHLGSADATDVLDMLRTADCKAPVVLTSGDSNGLALAQKYAAVIGLTADAVLNKPFTARQLIEILERGRLDHSWLDELDLEDAITQQWVYPVFQPQLDLIHGTIHSAELLTRFAHPAFGVIRPDQFIKSLRPAQAKTLFLSHLESLRKAAPRLRRHTAGFRFAVNVAPQTLLQCAGALQQLASDEPALWSSLVIEVTEEGISNMSTAELKSLYKLGIAGAQLSIDDFGTGSSNFARLAQLPFSEIKIDRSIVSGCAVTPAKKMLVKTIIGLAHQLSARVVAEGVERSDDYALLVESGCDALQGFILARSMKSDELERFMSEFNGRRRMEIPAK